METFTTPRMRSFVANTFAGDRAMTDAPEEIGSEEPEAGVGCTELSLIPLDGEEAKRYWRSRSPAERLCYAQYLRRIAYGPAADGPLERVLEVVSLDDR
jgi:hypothetical protein